MPSLPASQPAEDGEADGATAPPTVDLSSEEPHARSGGGRKSGGSPLTGASANAIHVLDSTTPVNLVLTQSLRSINRPRTAVVS